ncbi:MAG TPA: DUF72 domain-containing protein [Bacteroidia bacterium]
MSKKYYIGCSGYYYSAWKNKFYPNTIQPKEWLRYYSTIFNSVELNGTFYRTPRLSDLKRYREQTGGEFRFSVKMSKAITHIGRLNESAEQIAGFQKLIKEGLGNKLNYFLFQMPPSFHYTTENLDRIIKNIPHDPENVIEFRHLSWWKDEVIEELRKAKLTFCNIDYPGLDTWFITTSPHFYLRLHGNPQLFKSSYSTDKLKKFYAAFPKENKDFTIYFNNTYYEAGYTNASELVKIIEHA